MHVFCCGGGRVTLLKSRRPWLAESQRYVHRTSYPTPGRRSGRTRTRKGSSWSSHKHVWWEWNSPRTGRSGEFPVRAGSGGCWWLQEPFCLGQRKLLSQTVEPDCSLVFGSPAQVCFISHVLILQGAWLGCVSAFWAGWNTEVIFKHWLSFLVAKTYPKLSFTHTTSQISSSISFLVRIISSICHRDQVFSCQWHEQSPWGVFF